MHKNIRIRVKRSVFIDAYFAQYLCSTETDWEIKKYIKKNWNENLDRRDLFFYKLKQNKKWCMRRINNEINSSKWVFMGTWDVLLVSSSYCSMDILPCVHMCLMVHKGISHSTGCSRACMASYVKFPNTDTSMPPDSL